MEKPGISAWLARCTLFHASSSAPAPADDLADDPGPDEDGEAVATGNGGDVSRNHEGAAPTVALILAADAEWPTEDDVDRAHEDQQARGDDNNARQGDQHPAAPRRQAGRLSGQTAPFVAVVAIGLELRPRLAERAEVVLVQADPHRQKTGDEAKRPSRLEKGGQQVAAALGVKRGCRHGLSIYSMKCTRTLLLYYLRFILSIYNPPT